MLRTLLIAVVIFFVARYAYKLFRPRTTPRNESIHGRPRDAGRKDLSGPVEDVDFKDIPEK